MKLYSQLTRIPILLIVFVSTIAFTTILSQATQVPLLYVPLGASLSILTFILVFTYVQNT